MSQITDEQVEAALTAFYGAGAPHFDIHVRDDMRAALETIFTPPVGAETGEDNSDA